MSKWLPGPNVYLSSLVYCVEHTASVIEHKIFGGVARNKAVLDEALH